MHQIAKDIDLMLSIFPFEKEWYAERVPEFPVEFIGHPLVDRFPLAKPDDAAVPLDPDLFTEQPTVLLLPVQSYVNLLLEAGAELRSAGRTRFLEVDTGEALPGPSPTFLAILRATQ